MKISANRVRMRTFFTSFIVFVVVLSIIYYIGKLYWLLFPILSITIAVFFIYKTKRKRNCANTKILYLISIVLVFFAAIVIRVFIVEIYTISSSSMQNTIVPKDRVLVNKLSYGPVLPRSPYEIPWINAFYYLNPSNYNKIDSTWWKYRKLKGYSNIQLHDIVVFKLSDKDNYTYIKRCVAIPGDTLLIKESDIYINHIKQYFPQSILYKYTLHTSDAVRLQLLLDDMGILYREDNNSTNKHAYIILASENNINKLFDMPFVDSIRRCIQYQKVDFQSIFSENFNWSIDNFGPILIPRKGEKIALNHYNYMTYKELLQYGEKTYIEEMDNCYLINGIIQTDYIFQNNYFFLMGDNRYQSKDSRFYGLINEEMIIGKTERILFSTYNNTFHWNRLLKKIF